MYKLFILDSDTWYYVTVWKKLLRNNYTKKNMNTYVKWMQFSYWKAQNKSKQIDMP